MGRYLHAVRMIRSFSHASDSLFSTHPATENRVAALLALTRRTPPPSPRGSQPGRARTAVPVTEDSHGPWN